MALYGNGSMRSFKCVRSTKSGQSTRNFRSAPTMKKIFFFAVPLLLVSTFAAAKEKTFDTHSTWSLKSATAREIRWIEIHQIDKGLDIIHVEVLSKNKGKGYRTIKHVQPHLAIRRRALEASVEKA